jgi:hypothetical protein
MEYTFACDQRFTIYKNLGTSARNVNIAVQEHCKGTSQVNILDSANNVLSGTSFSSPGGAVTLSVGPDQEVQVFCVDGKDPQGCRAEISL